MGKKLYELWSGQYEDTSFHGRIWIDEEEYETADKQLHKQGYYLEEVRPDLGDWKDFVEKEKREERNAHRRYLYDRKRHPEKYVITPLSRFYEKEFLERVLKPFAPIVVDKNKYKIDTKQAKGLIKFKKYYGDNIK